jgi:hypothetical protein
LQHYWISSILVMVLMGVVTWWMVWFFKRKKWL